MGNHAFFVAKCNAVYYNNLIMKVAFHTLGCKVNQYESEAMAQMFRGRGWDVVDEREFADVYVINTCTVTATADKKSRQYIRRMKRVNPDSVVAVTGCFSQISPDEVSKIKGGHQREEHSSGLCRGGAREPSCGYCKGRPPDGDPSL